MLRKSEPKVTELEKKLTPNNLNLAIGLKILNSNKRLQTPENYNLLSQYPQDAAGIAAGLKWLAFNGQVLDTEENRALLLKDPKYTGMLTTALEFLNRAEIATPENYILLTQNPQYSYDISLGLMRLFDGGTRFYRVEGVLIEDATNEGILNTAENRHLLAKYGKHAKMIALALEHLDNASIITQENYNTLIKHRDFLGEIIRAIAPLDEKPEIAQERFNSIIQGIDKRAREQRTAFFMGSHLRLGKNSSVKIVSDVKDVTEEILSFLPTPRK